MNWKETDGKTTWDVPTGWSKGWINENTYGWTWHGPPGIAFKNLCVFIGEPTREQRLQIQIEHVDAATPEPLA